MLKLFEKKFFSFFSKEGSVDEHFHLFLTRNFVHISKESNFKKKIEEKTSLINVASICLK